MQFQCKDEYSMYFFKCTVFILHFFNIYSPFFLSLTVYMYTRNDIYECPLCLRMKVNTFQQVVSSY